MKISAILLALLFPLAAAKAETIYVADNTDRQIFSISSTGVVSLFAQLPADASPFALALDNFGNLFVADNKRIDRITPAGVVSVFVSGLSVNVFSLAFDSQGNLFAGGEGNPSGLAPIFKITSQGAVSTFFQSNALSASGLAFASNGDLYAADQIDKLAKITPSGVLTRVGTNARGQGDVELDGLGNIYSTAYEQGRLDKIDASGNETTVAFGLGVPFALAIDSSKTLFVTDINTDTIFKVTSSGTVSSFAHVTSPFGIAIGVPEPSTLSFLVFGSAMLLRRRRRISKYETVSYLGMSRHLDRAL